MVLMPATPWQVVDFPIIANYMTVLTHLLLEKMAAELQTTVLVEVQLLQWKQFFIEVCSLGCDRWDVINGLHSGLI